MKILYDPNAGTLQGIRGASGDIEHADVVVGRDGIILKARNGHRAAVATIKSMGRKVAK